MPQVSARIRVTAQKDQARTLRVLPEFEKFVIHDLNERGFGVTSLYRSDTTGLIEVSWANASLPPHDGSSLPPAPPPMRREIDWWKSRRLCGSVPFVTPFTNHG
ncbi:hypothetical protein MF271_23835 (plasmid) [Deinococcus sp. KNUC1210]|uniref:hypothetical protein n=1 Tax=Deinococcus sp. KNUC1210 TaxID=2917691 RepID=UPI001EEFB3EF|nr:hypothetical protein [Deinococcus sp. KNUC1210]ULH17995.1 hypothetical protein MF271_23835 [Deinococcus sp. KNUC1210]